MEGENLLSVILAMAVSLSITTGGHVSPGSIKVVGIYYHLRLAVSGRRLQVRCAPAAHACCMQSGPQPSLLFSAARCCAADCTISERAAVRSCTPMSAADLGDTCSPA